MDTAECSDMRIAGIRKWWDLIRESKIFIKDKTKVACRISGIEWRVVYFRKLLFETNDEKFSFGRVKSKKICRHPGGNLLQSGLEVGDTWIKVARMEWEKKLELSLCKSGGLEKVRRWECWVGWCTWRKVQDQEQSLEEHHKKKYAPKRSLYHIWHGKSEMLGKTQTSLRQSHEFKPRWKAVD